MKIKRFIVFSYYDFEEYGGWGDFRGSFDTIEEATDLVSKEYSLSDVYIVQIVDSETGGIVNED